MLTKVHIENFKCLKDTEISLGPFNVLIGPNDSGKTSFLRALEVLGAAQLMNVADVVWEKKRDRSVRIEAFGPQSNAFSYSLTVSPVSGLTDERLVIGNQVEMEVTRNPQNRWILNVKNHGQQVFQPNQRGLLTAAALEIQRGLSGPIADVLNEFQSSGTYELDPRAMRSPASATPHASLDSRGQNLAAVLQGMLSGPDRQAILDLESKLHDAVPTLRGVSTPVTGGNTYQVAFTLNTNAKPPISISCMEASDGALLLTGFLVLVYGNAPRRLLIEEPENGLHPSRLKMVIDILRKISTGEIGNEPRQVIITTHSPLLLNFVQPEEVRVFRRDPIEGTKVVSMDQIPNIAKLRHEFAPGELWYLFGEEDLVRGKAS